ncbi:MAG: Na+/H+ antiporter subunit E [Rhodobacteraceae bacterium]|nr:Na+/H+ antiporter subunit E [Paracoccaceae bacterium]
MTLLLRPYYILRLFALFCWDLLISSLQVARAVLTPGESVAPRFVIVPLKAARSDLEIALVANYITLTPGTLTVDVSPDRRTLLIHSLLAGSSGDGVRADVAAAIEPRVLKATRG